MNHDDLQKPQDWEYYKKFYGYKDTSADLISHVTGVLAASVMGGLLIGVVLMAFGGRGKDVATVVGALGGGYAGNQIQGSLQESDTYTTTQQRCKTVYDKSEKMLGYDVTYKIGDQQGKIRMDRDPGTQIPLDSNGQLILNNKV